MKKPVLYVLVLLCSGLQILVAQTVTGTVSSGRDGQSFPGVTVQINGTATGTATDINCIYSINILPPEKERFWKTSNVYNPHPDKEIFTTIYKRSCTNQILEFLFIKCSKQHCHEF